MPRARTLAERALAMSGTQGAPQRYLPLYVLSEIAFFEGAFDEVERLCAELRDLSVPPAHSSLAVQVELLTVLLPAYQGRTELALERAERFVIRGDRDGDPLGIAWTRYALAEVIGDSDPARALDLLDDVEARTVATGANFLRGVALVTAASLRARHGDAHEARALFVQVVRWWQRAGNWSQQWTTMRNVVDLLVRLGDDEHAATLHGAISARTAAPPPFGSDAQRLAQAEATLRERLGDAAFTSAAERGATLSDAEVVTWLRGVLEGTQEPV